MTQVQEAGTYQARDFVDSFFNELPADLRYAQTTYREYGPASFESTSKLWQFALQGDSATFLKVADMELRIGVKMTNNTGAPLPKAELWSVTNNFLHSYISRLEVRIGTGVPVKVCSGSDYPYKAYLSTLLNFNGGAASTHLSSQGYTPETRGAMQIPQDFSLDTQNPGRYTRAQWFKVRPLHGNVIEDTDWVAPDEPVFFQGKLFTDLEMCKAGLPPFTKVEVDVYVNNAAFYTLGKNTLQDVDFKLEATKVRLMVPQSNMTAQAYEQFSKKWKIQNCLLHTRPTVLTVVNVATSDTNTFEYTAPFQQGRLPSLMVVGLVSHDAYMGTFNENPFNFQHKLSATCFVEYISVSVGGIDVDGEMCEKSTTMNVGLNQYHKTMNALGLDRTNRSVDYSYDQFMAGSHLMAFDLTASKQVASQLLVPSVSIGVMKISVKFNIAPPRDKPMKMIIFGQRSGLITINSVGKVETTFME